VKDENAREIGKITSFLIDSSGLVREVLIENRNEEFVRFPVEGLKIDREEISLTTSIEKRAEVFSEKFPLTQKKRRILDRLKQNSEILPEIYEKLCSEFDKTLEEMKGEAKVLLEEAEKEVMVQEDYIKTLHLARTFLEIEHGIDNVKDDIYQVALIPILKEMKNASYRKINLLRIKDKVSSVLVGDGEVESTKDTSKEQNNSTIAPTEQKPVITVHMTQE